MQAHRDGQAVGLLQELLALPVHLHGGHVFTVPVVGASRAGTEHSLAADLDLVGGPVSAGAGRELVPGAIDPQTPFCKSSLSPTIQCAWKVRGRHIHGQLHRRFHHHRHRSNKPLTLQVPHIFPTSSS